MRIPLSKVIGLSMVFLLLSGLAANPLSAEELKRIGFGFGINNHMGSDSRFSGMGSFFLLTIRLSDETFVSLLREEFKLNGNGTSAQGLKRDIDVDANITGMRIQRKISSLLNVGIDVGNAGFSDGIVDNTIMAGVIVSFTPLESQSKLMDSKLDIDLGYRLLNVKNADPFGDPNKLVKDLNTFFIGLNMKILF